MKKSSLFSLPLPLIMLLFLLSASSWSQERSKRVVLMYSSYGMGHLSAARAIKDDILRKDPNVEVVLKDIRDFEPKVSGYVMEKAYWYIVKNHPDLFTKMYNGTMDAGMRAKALKDIQTGYDEEGLLKFLQEENKKGDLVSVVATHYGAAQTLGGLRAKGKITEDLQRTKIGWLHTDYIGHYFPRISKTIDMTFVPHQALETTWAESGVVPRKVTTTGMPVNPKVRDVLLPAEKREFFTQKELDPEVMTITLASGGEGVGDFPTIVKSLADKFKAQNKKVQIVAVTANNKKHFKNLSAMKGQLPEGVDLKVLGFVPQEELLKYIKGSDVFITKSGGLTPSEGFAIGRPIVLLDVYGGHERENAVFFDELGMAVVNKAQKDIGSDVWNLINDKEKIARMLKAQEQFRVNFNIGKISDFALSPEPSSYVPNPRLGVQDGDSLLEEGRAELAKLDKDSPSDVEVLMSYSVMDGRTVYPNPFGHIAVKIGDRVYTANGQAKKDENGIDDFVVGESLAEYLYTTKPVTNDPTHSFFVDAYGETYGRDVLGLRVKGLPPEGQQRMKEEVAKIEDEWRRGLTCFDQQKNNCANVVERILKAGGIDLNPVAPPKGAITTPLDLYDRYFKYFNDNLKYRTEVVHYAKVDDSKAVSDETHQVYKQSRFPVSMYQPKAAASRLIWPYAPDQHEEFITKRVAAYPGGLSYENIDGYSFPKVVKRFREAQRRDHDRKDLLVKMEEILEQAQEDFKANGEKAEDLQREYQALMLQAPSKKKEKAIKVFQDKVDGWIKKHDVFQSFLDEYVQNQVDYIIDKAHDELEIALENIRTKITTQEHTEITGLLKTLGELHQDFVRKRGLYGQPKDYQRQTAFREFFYKAGELVNKVNGIIAQKKAVAPSLWQRLGGAVYGLGQSLYNVGGYLNMAYNMTGPMVSLVKELYYPADAKDGETPFTQKSVEAFGRLGDQLGYQVEVEGQENLLVSSPDSNVVNIYAPTHKDPMLDGYIMGKLGLKDHFTFAAVDQFMPKFLGDRVDKDRSMIVVGRGSDRPIEEVLEKLRQRVSKNILIYPQGSTTLMNETQPIRGKFSSGLLKALEAAGYKVNLIPITYVTQPRFISLEGKDEDKKLKAKISNPISPDFLKMLMDKDGVNTFLRAVWLENQPSDAKITHGQLRTEELEKKKDELLAIHPDLKGQLAFQLEIGGTDCDGDGQIEEEMPDAEFAVGLQLGSGFYGSQSLR